IAAEGSRRTTLTLSSGKLTTIRNPDNGLRTFSYEASTNRLTNENFATESRSWAYSSGRVSSATAGTGGDATTKTITPAAVQGLSALVAGEPQAVMTDGLSHSVKTTLDASGRPLQQLAGDGGLWVWTRDNQGRVTKETDPLNRVTTYLRDTP